MAPDDQKTAGNQAINHLKKSGCFEHLLVVSEEVVSQKNKLKVPIWGIMQEVMEPP